MPASKTKPARTPKKAPAGRPSLFTAERRATFVQAVQLGAAWKHAAQAAGWSERLAQVYLQRGRQFRGVEDGHEIDPVCLPPLTVEEAAYAQFVRDVERAEGEAGRAAMAMIVKAAQKGTWQAAAWLLERRWPEHYARRTQVEVSGPDGGPLQAEVTVDHLLEQLEKVTEVHQLVEARRRVVGER